MDRRHLAQPAGWGRDDSDGAPDRYSARLWPRTRALSRPGADRERHLGTDNRAAHRDFDCDLWAVLKTRTDWRVVWHRGGAYRIGVAVRRHRAAVGFAGFRHQP